MSNSTAVQTDFLRLDQIVPSNRRSLDILLNRMHQWFFAKIVSGEHPVSVPAALEINQQDIFSPSPETSHTGQVSLIDTNGSFLTPYSLSVILPAHNEEAIIKTTIQNVIEVLTPWVAHFEIIIVNDGSKDHTKAIVKDLMAVDRRVRLIDHEVNQGYGAALVSGFNAVKTDLAFFMDADGQFDIRDLATFFPLIQQYDAVLGYRIHRQDTWMRKLNAWGWKMLTRLFFGLQVRDVDCAFKLYRAEFFSKHLLETSGAMINTEILYKWKRARYTYTQVGVQHLPRRSGHATGAKLSVILRAFKELTYYAWKWHREEREMNKAKRITMDTVKE